MTVYDDAVEFVNARLASAAGVELDENLEAESAENGVDVARRMVADQVELEDLEPLLATLVHEAVGLHKTGHEVDCGPFVLALVVAQAQAWLLGNRMGRGAA